LERRYRLKAEGFDIEKVIERAADISGLTAEQIRTAGKEPGRVSGQKPCLLLAAVKDRMSNF